MIARFLRRERGQSIAELALALPIMTFALLGGADLARGYAVLLAVQNGARAGAEASALDVTPTSSEATTHAQQEMNRTPGMNVSNATITLTFTQADGSTACTGAADTSVAGTSSIATPCYANMRVRYTFSTLIAWPLIPRDYAFDRTTRMRRYA